MSLVIVFILFSKTIVDFSLYSILSLYEIYLYQSFITKVFYINPGRLSLSPVTNGSNVNVLLIQRGR
jgi:hypothetical protein